MRVDNVTKRGYTWGMNMTDALRIAIRTDGRSLNALGRAAGVDPGVLSRFLRDERTLTLSTADQICAGLAVDVRLVRLRKGR